MAQILPIPLEHFNAHGFAVIPSVFTIEEMSHFRAAALAALKLHPQNATWKQHKEPTILSAASKLSPLIESYIRSPTVAAIVNGFLGPNVRQILDQIHFRGAYGSESFGWHQDITFRTPKEHFSDDIAKKHIQLIICIDDMDPLNGGIEVIPRSHLEGDVGLLKSELDQSIKKFVRDGKTGIKLSAKSGDVLLWSLLTIHGSEANRSPKPRMTYLGGFSAEDAVLIKWRFPVYEAIKG